MNLVGCIDDRPVCVLARKRGDPEADVPACAVAQLPADRIDPIVVCAGKDHYVKHPPTGADRIAGAASSTIRSAGAHEAKGLTGWIARITARDLLGLDRHAASAFTGVPAARPVEVS